MSGNTNFFHLFLLVGGRLQYCSGFCHTIKAVQQSELEDFLGPKLSYTSYKIFKLVTLVKGLPGGFN